MDNVCSGYKLLSLDIFNRRLESLIQEVEKLAESGVDFYNHPSYTLLECVGKEIYGQIPSNPDSRDYHLGNTLDKLAKTTKQYSQWKRAKKRLPARYRLYFKYQSQPDSKSIVYAWLNDEDSLRKEGAKTDVYATFLRLVKSGTIPNTWDELIAASEDLSQVS